MRKILVPALAVFTLFAVSSCGDDPDASGPPILVLSANGGGWSATAPAASDMSTAEGMDEKMMWGYQQNFTAAVDLPALDSDAPSYTLAAGDVSTDSLNVLKAAFEVTEDFACPFRHRPGPRPRAGQPDPHPGQGQHGRRHGLHGRDLRSDRGEAPRHVANVGRV